MMAGKGMKRRHIGTGEPSDGNLAQYTLGLPRREFMLFKVLCTLRGESIKTALSRMIGEEVTRATEKGILPKIR